VELKQLANQLQAGHAMLALLTKNPMLAITEDESVRLANAIKAVLVFHNMSVNPKMAAYGELAIACVMIYGSRLGMMAMQKKQQKAQEAKIMQMPQTSQANSNPFPQQQNGKINFQ
jgi:hypothetical protein